MELRSTSERVGACAREKEQQPFPFVLLQNRVLDVATSIISPVYAYLEKFVLGKLNSNKNSAYVTIFMIIYLKSM